MDKITPEKLMHYNWIELGATTEVLKFRAQMEDKKRAAEGTLKVTDTEENLMKKYKEIYGKILDILKETVAQEKKHPEKAFWTHLHQSV